MKALLILLFTMTAHALPDAKQASEICGRLGIHLQNECFEKITAKSFSDTAVAECSRYAGQKESFECVAEVANTKFDSKAIKHCTQIRMWSGQEELAVACMAAIANKKYTEDELTACEKGAAFQGTISCLETSYESEYGLSEKDSPPVAAPQKQQVQSQQPAPSDYCPPNFTCK